MKFDQAVEYILKHEGGYVNSPMDPGGKTKFGISQRTYPNLDIFNLTKEDAIEIYKKDFWDKMQLDLFPPSMRLIVFDCAVNQGPGAAVGLLQAALGVKVDGLLGPDTFKKMNEANSDKLVNAYARFRLNRYIENPKFQHFGEGWIRRLFDISLTSKDVA
jgi:lysozyme family protein